MARMLCKDMRARIEKQLIGALILLGAVAASPGASASAEPRSLSGSVKNGLIAYSYKGDIYVGDMRTRKTRAVVTNPKYEVNPMLAPDGERIAFIRGDPQTGKRSRGRSSRRFRRARPIPKGRNTGGLGTSAGRPTATRSSCSSTAPISLSLMSDGELSLFDPLCTGQDRPHPAPATSLGGHYSQQPVAPMFRPPWETASCPVTETL